jgi:hypothetical protein
MNLKIGDRVTDGKRFGILTFAGNLIAAVRFDGEKHLTARWVKNLRLA